ncbi:hypothetical protein EQF93_02555 [Helcococcus ovis]|uniref:hypothetical protein n=1 Tax=Helcococcus ovis TaxID=72026 RepID=UPI00106FB8EF|nr:hypothetical protein [Helcococcus ovis]TFF68337.1 hypothetical protein EQF93_02555 [Helcococcus ovis]WNZ00911.1 hypothetical protein EQF90_006495 [Helcococcus ovis]
MKDLQTVNIKEASEKLNISEQALRLALQQGVFPFGVAVKHPKNYEYYIYKIRLEKYLKGEL